MGNIARRPDGKWRARYCEQLSHTLAPSTVGVAHRILSGTLKSAVADRRIVPNPCTGT